jgi:hypothetical protein
MELDFASRGDVSLRCLRTIGETAADLGAQLMWAQ